MQIMVQPIGGHFCKTVRIASWSFLRPIGALLLFFHMAFPASAQTTISITHPADRTGIVEQGLAALARDLTEASNGSVDLQPVSVPTDDARRSVQLVYDGEAALALLPIGEAVELSEKFAVFERPFLFDNLDAVGRFVDSEQGRVVLDSLREYGLLGFGLLHQDLRDLAGADLSADPGSLQGRQLGVDERIDIRPFDEAGASSQPMLPAAMADALTEGQIDAVEVTTPTVAADATLQNQQRLLLTDHRYDGWVLVANRDWLENLSEDSRAAFRVTVVDTLAQLNAEATERVVSVLASLRDDGMDVIELDFAIKDQWRAAMADSLTRYEDLVTGEIVTAARRANISSLSGEPVDPPDTGPVVLDGDDQAKRRTYSTLPWNVGGQTDYTPVQLFFGTDRRNAGNQEVPDSTAHAVAT